VGSFADGTTSPPVNPTLTNNGTANLDISASGVTITGANSTDFSQTNTCANSSIAAGGTCSFSITFTPSIVGNETAELQVTDDGVGSPQTLALTGTGTAVGVTVNPTSLTFPNTAQGQVSSAQTATVTNTSSDTLSIQQASISGTNATDFEYGTANNCGASTTITPGNSCTIAVQFAPNEPNPPSTGLALTAQDSLTLLDTTNQSTQTVNVSLSGTEVPAQPGITLSPTSLTFGGQNVGSSTAPQSITVTSNGSAPLAISSISITGANPGDFSETNTCPTNPSTLAVNANCTISVTFTPAATGPRSAAVSISDNATGSPQTVPISGTGTAAGVTLTPLNLIFAGQDPGTPASPPQSVTLTNSGTGPLTISSITVTGNNASDFAETNNCPIGPSATLPSGQACSIAVTFAPTGSGPRSASLTISDSAIPSPQVVGLSGVGTVPSAEFSVEGIGLQFSSTVVGAKSSSQTAQLNSTGNGILVISKVGFTGSGAGDFQASGSCVGAGGASVSVQPGSSCNVAVVFAPTTAGPLAATLSVTDNAANSPQQLPVTGNGTNFQMGAVSGGSTSVTINAGETATFSLQIAPVNGFSGTVGLSCTDPIPVSSCSIAPTQVTVSGSSAVGFTVTITTSSNATSSRLPFFALPANWQRPLLVELWLLAFALLVLLRLASSRQRAFRPAVLLVGVLLISSCAGGNNNSSSGTTPSGAYTVTIAGNNSGVTNTVPLSVTLQ
jgi:hypothetical protein